jgi:hypothetical protein
MKLKGQENNYGEGWNVDILQKKMLENNEPGKDLVVTVSKTR